MKRKYSLFIIVIINLFFSYGVFSAKTVYGAQEFVHGYPSSSGALHVEGNRLLDSHGQQIQLKGISTHGIAWFPQYINGDAFKEFRYKWDVNVMRLAMYTAESGGYCTDGNKVTLMGLIDQGVEYAIENDMYVIIDWHILSDGNPNTYIEESKTFWAEVSDKYCECENVIYEICNEPNGDVSWQEIKEYAEQIIEIIRQKDQDAVIIVGTPNWSQNVGQAAESIINGYENIMYALHFYAATHQESLRSEMQKAVESGLPIFVTEYGICDASGNGEIDEEQADRWVTLMNQYGISYVAWSLSNKAESASMLKAACTKTSGFLEDDLSQAGKWLYQTLVGEELREEILQQDIQDESEAAQNIRDEAEAAQNIQDESEAAQNIQDEAEIVKNVRIEPESLQCQLAINNQWEVNENIFYQYGICLLNQTDTVCEDWKISITFIEEIKLSDGWNGVYEEEENTLVITPKEYNKQIGSAESKNDIGFIISMFNK